MTQRVEIVLIDDNTRDILLIDEVLRELNSKVQLRVLQNHVDATEYLFFNSKENSLSNLKLILLEITLSNYKGLELLHSIKTHPDLRKIPVLILSNSQNPNHVQICYEENVNAYLRKPSSKENFSFFIKLILRLWMDIISLPEHTWS